MSVQEQDAKIAAKISEHCSHSDRERAHVEADELLVKLVRTLGFKQTADAWEAVDKRYA